MRYLTLFASIAVLFTVVSCKSGTADYKNVTTPSTTPTLTVPANPGTPGTMPVNPAPVVTPTTNTNTTANVPTTTTTTTNATPPNPKPGVALNPAHGQPGHRCEIAVGAPLDSKPATTLPSTQPTVTTTPTVTTPTVTTQPPVINSNPIQPATTTVTAPGMNPPHGQPNHRCDIAVGAPLNSKPNAAVSTVPAATPKQ